MNLISFDVGPNRIAAVQGSVNNNFIEITAADSVPLKRGLVVDSMIKNQPEVIGALTNLLARNRTFAAGKTVVTINPGNALIREFTVPSGNVRQLDAMVRSEMLNYNAAGTTDVIEYKVLENVAGEGGVKSVQVRAVSLGISIIESYYNVLQGVRLRPAAMDVHSNAVEKLLARKPQLNGMDMKGNGFILMDIGYSGVLAYIVYDYKVYASRFIPIGLADFEPGLFNARAGVYGVNDTPPDFNQMLDFRKEGTADPDVMHLAEQTLLECCNELQKLIIYSTPRMPRSALSCVILTGDGSRIPGIDAFIASELNTSVMPLSYISGVKFSKASDEKELPYLFNAVSALIRL